MRCLGNILSVLFLSTLLSCEVKVPDYVIPPQKMEAFLYDYHLIQSMNGQYSSDDYREKLYYSYIFNKHNIFYKIGTFNFTGMKEIFAKCFALFKC